MATGAGSAIADWKCCSLTPRDRWSSQRARVSRSVTSPAATTTAIPRKPLKRVTKAISAVLGPHHAIGQQRAFLADQYVVVDDAVDLHMQGLHLGERFIKLGSANAGSGATQSAADATPSVRSGRDLRKAIGRHRRADEQFQIGQA